MLIERDDRPAVGVWSAVCLALFWAFVLVLGWRLAGEAAFSLTDAQVLFHPALVGGPWSLSRADAAGPHALIALEAWVVRAVWGLSPTAFHAAQGVKLALVAFFAWGVMRASGARPGRALLAGVLLLTTPAFLDALTRLFSPELSCLTLLAGGLYFLPSIGARGARVGFWASLAFLGAAMSLDGPTAAALGAAGLGLAAWAMLRGAHVLFSHGLCLALLGAGWVAVHVSIGAGFSGQGGGSPDLLEAVGGNVLLALALPVLCLDALWRVRRLGSFGAQDACLVGAALLTVLELAASGPLGLRLLPAYALALPALGRMLAGPAGASGPVMMLGAGRTGGSHGLAWGVAGFCLALALGLASVSGGLFALWHNMASAQGAGDFLGLLEVRRPRAGEPRTVLMLPRLAPESAQARGLAAELARRGLDAAYELRFPGGEDLFPAGTGAASGEAMLILTPDTPVSDAELAHLGGCLSPLLATPQGGGSFASDGVWAAWMASPYDWKRFQAQYMWPRGSFAVFAGDVAGCRSRFDWNVLKGMALADGLAVCPLTRELLTFRLTNTAPGALRRQEHAKGGEVKIVLAAFEPGAPPRPLGVAELPEHLGPGESVDLELGFGAHIRAPLVVAAFPGVVRNGSVRILTAAPLFTGHLRPRLGACLGTPSRPALPPLSPPPAPAQPAQHAPEQSATDQAAPPVPDATAPTSESTRTTP